MRRPFRLALALLLLLASSCSRLEGPSPAATAGVEKDEGEKEGSGPAPILAQIELAGDHHGDEDAPPESEEASVEAASGETGAHDERAFGKTGGAAAPTSISRNKWLRDTLYHQQGDNLYWYMDAAYKSQWGTAAECRALIARAAAAWQAYLPFTLTEASSEAAANIVIRFTRDSTFTRKGKTAKWATRIARNRYRVALAYAYDPEKTKRGLGFDRVGDILVNDLVHWDLDADTIAPGQDSMVVDTISHHDGASAALGKVHNTLLEVLTHEMGHVLGLGHDPARLRGGRYANIMAPEYGPEFGTGTLGEADIRHLTRLYHMPFHFVHGLAGFTGYGDYLSVAVDSVFKTITGRALTSGAKSYNKRLRQRLLSRGLPQRDSAVARFVRYNVKHAWLEMARDSAWGNARDSALWLNRLGGLLAMDSIVYGVDTVIASIDSSVLSRVDTTLASIDTAIAAIDTVADIDTTVAGIDSSRFDQLDPDTGDSLFFKDTTLAFDTSHVYDTSLAYDTTLAFDSTFRHDTTYAEDAVSFEDTFANHLLSTAQADRDSALSFLLSSREFDSALVVNEYERLLGTAPGNADFTAWVNDLQDGDKTPFDLVVYLAGSKAFWDGLSTKTTGGYVSQVLTLLLGKPYTASSKEARAWRIFLE